VWLQPTLRSLARFSAAGWVRAVGDKTWPAPGRSAGVVARAMRRVGLLETDLDATVVASAVRGDLAMHRAGAVCRTSAVSDFQFEIRRSRATTFWAIAKCPPSLAAPRLIDHGYANAFAEQASRRRASLVGPHPSAIALIDQVRCTGPSPVAAIQHVRYAEVPAAQHRIARLLTYIAAAKFCHMD